MGDDRWALEDSNGKFIYSPSENDILTVLEKIGKGLEHCNFSGPGDTWVSAAGLSSELMIYYGDSSGQYESVRYDFTAEEAARILSSLMKGDLSWKKQYDFNSTGAAAQSQAQSASAGTASGGTGSFSSSSNESSGGQPGEKKSLKDQLIDAAKSEAANNLNRLVKKGVRGLFGKKF